MSVARSIRNLGAIRVAALLVPVLLATPPPAAGQGEDGGNSEYVVPLFPSADDVQAGLARIVNHSDRSGTVRISGTDDSGHTHGPVTLLVDASATRHLDARDLESGNASKGLSEGLGDGDGSWRLRLETGLDIEVGAYLQTPDGILSAVHGVVRTLEVEGDTVHRVPIFGGGTDGSHVSSLRVSNLTDAEVEVTISAHDDEGEPAPGGEVGLTLAARATRRISAQQLELGDDGLDGRLGDGEGRWRLSLTADGDGEIEVVSLLRSPAGHLANLSGSGLRPAHASPPRPEMGTTFRDCPGCQEMVVVPAGSYRMGSPADETDRDPDEGPVRQVTISDPFAVGRFEVTFAEWDACHADGGCSRRPGDQGWGRGDRPVVDVSWWDAGEYVRWLSARTGRWYRLLSESEWEYVARAGTATRYWWGDEVGDNRASCDGCGSQWDARQTAPVGSFPPNEFGLHDVHGNVWEWVQDCRNGSYEGAPDDASAWESGLCGWRGVRGGSWQSGTVPRYVRAANRGWNLAQRRTFLDAAAVGFRIARSLSSPARQVLPLFPPAGSTRQGVGRIINRSDRTGTVHVDGTDDAGRWLGDLAFELTLDAGETAHFHSDDLSDEALPADLAERLGLEGSGDGKGYWRLQLLTDLDIEPSAYIRSEDGFLTAMHDVVRPTEEDGGTVHRVPIFNPASNLNQASWLHVANPTRDSAEVTIRGRDDSGEPAPGGEVRLDVPARSARRISAEQLESGDADLTGSLGDGEGRWQLFVTADADIEVVNLLQGATGHLSNLSTTVRGGFEIAADGSATVRPLETIHLTVPGGLGDSDYTVFMDLTGTGTFPADDTIEIEGLTTDDDRILFASPLTQILPEGNTSHRLAVRVRKESNQATSNVLHYSIDAITSVAGPPGFATMVFEAIVKSMYSSVDDPLLNLKAASIRPGLVTWSAARLGVDTTFSDVLAEAAMQSLLGMPVTELAPDSLDPSPSAARGAEDLPQVLTAFPNSRPGETSRLLRCERSLLNVGGICTKIREELTDEEETRKKVEKECEHIDFPDECLVIEKREQINRIERAGQRYLDIVKDVVIEVGSNLFGGFAIGKVKSAMSGKLLQFVRKTKGDTVARKSLQAMNDANRLMDIMEKSAEIYRVYEAYDDGDGQKGKADSNRDFDGSGQPTKKGLQNNFESHKDNQQTWKEYLDELLPGLKGLRPDIDDGTRESFSVLENDIDRRRREAEGIDDLEGVYTGEESPSEAIGNDPRRGMVVAENCKFGYQEFPIDDKISTCVFESLVEPECYKGSRQPPEVDLGDSEVCLYYSLDKFLPEFLPEQRCRDNYERAKNFRGKWTCRWEDLGPEEPAWYTLHKPEDDEIDDRDGDNPVEFNELAKSCITLSPVKLPSRDFDPNSDVFCISDGGSPHATIYIGDHWRNRLVRPEVTVRNKCPIRLAIVLDARIWSASHKLWYTRTTGSRYLAPSETVVLELARCQEIQNPPVIDSICADTLAFPQCD